MRCVKIKIVFDTHCLLRWADFVLIEKSCKLINERIRIKPENWKKERNTHTTFHADAIVNFVLQAVEMVVFITIKS